MPSDRTQADDARNGLVQKQQAALVPGELLGDRLSAPATPPQPSETEINDRYDRGEIRIVTEQARYPLDSVTGLLSSGNYKLDPEYQRRHRWSDGQKSRLIESFIMNVPVPPIFLYEYDFNRYEVMDGLQRLTAIRDFYNDIFPLSSLQYWTELEGMRYSKLPSRIRDGINRRYLSSIVLLKETTHGDEDPDQLKRFVFGRINTGGVQLSQQELRNALYDGPMNRLCKKLASNPHLRRLWGIPENIESLVGDALEEEDRLQDESDVKLHSIPSAWRDMTDVELVLRFFANRQRVIADRDTLRGYLDDYLQAANMFSASTLEALESVFNSTLELAEDIFGEQAFKRYRGKQWVSVPSVSIFDSLMNVLCRNLPLGPQLIAKRDEIMEGLPDFYIRNSEVFNLRGQTRAYLIRREVEFEDYLLSFTS
jgi:hypothetical protein